MEKKLNIRQFYIVLFTFSFSSISYCNIWVEPEDEHFVKHLELAFMDLNSAVDTTTYPISSELLKNVNYIGLYSTKCVYAIFTKKFL